MIQTFVVGFLILVVVASNEPPQARVPQNLQLISQSPIDGQSLNGWTKRNQADPHQTVSLLIALYPRNIPLLQKIADQVSDPRSLKYGKYLLISDITEIVKPSPEDIDVVSEWLHSVSQGLSVSWHQNRDFVEVEATVKTIQTLFNFSGESLLFAEYVHPKAKHAVVRTTSSVFLPNHLSKSIQLIEGLYDLPIIPKHYHDYKKERQLSSAIKPKKSYIKSQQACTLADTKVEISSIEPFSEMLSIIAASENCDELKVISWKFEWQPYNSTLNFTLQQQHPAREQSQTIYFYGIPNYIPGIVRVAAVYSDNTTSPFSDPFGPIVTHDVATPEFLRRFYGVPRDLMGNGNSKFASQGLYEQASGWNVSEAMYFFQQMGVEMSADLFSTVRNFTSGLGGEESLDVDTIVGVAPNISTLYWNGVGSLLNWLAWINNHDNASLVHSTSWYMEESSLNNATAERIEAELVKIAARGITLVAANGDYGANGPIPCSKKKASTQFPGAHPYFLSVGASMPTNLLNDAPLCRTPFNQQPDSRENPPIVCSANSEVPASIKFGATFTTAGAFSTKFPRPSYQDKVVTDYLSYMNQTGRLPPESYFHSSNRGFSDVIAIGHIYYTFGSGLWSWNGGTSASAPAVAGILSLANFVLISNGKPPLGFVNPLLYALKETNPEVFNQISIGDNKCSGWFSTLRECCDLGFEAYNGSWSPVTGLGSINFERFIYVLLHNNTALPGLSVGINN